jgi:hypothetical protein
MAAVSNPADFELNVNMLGSGGASRALPQQGVTDDMSRMFGK